MPFLEWTCLQSPELLFGKRASPSHHHNPERTPANENKEHSVNLNDMKVLFIGGTGIISSGCLQPCLDRGIELTLLNRGQSWRTVPEGINVVQADIRQPESVAKVLGSQHWDAVVDWVAFTVDHIQSDFDLFKDHTNQFVFISSASAYQKPPTYLPITESGPLINPYWQYSRNKIACEELLTDFYRNQQFPITIIRPSHTYDRSLLPFDHGWTVVDRMLKGKPVIVHGDGTSLWTLTHHKDFAKGFVPLLGDPKTIGHAFTITSDEWLTWDQIYDMVADAAGTKAIKVHVASETLAKFDPRWGDSLIGDKANSVIFDNSKIKRFVPEFNCSIPFSQGAREIISWYDANPQRKQISLESDALAEKIIAAVSKIGP